MRAWHALAAYACVTVAATWPLALAPGRNVAWDLGDSLVAMWALAWDGDQILAILTGEFSRITTFFDANVFHPAPRALAFSEHLVPQALQILPIYAATKNPILAYNLLLLSTFVLSGFGTFLFVRDLTRSTTAAFVAGLLFAFSALRISHGGHLDALSMQWMPFVLFAVRRYVTTGRTLALAGAAAALILQNLSSLHYLFFFAPFAVAYAVWEVAWTQGTFRWRTVNTLAAAGLVVTAITLPFVLPYAEIRLDLGLRHSRGAAVRSAADVYAYATTYPEQPVWGTRARAFPQPEGALFPGLVALALALAGLTWRGRRTDRDAIRHGALNDALPADRRDDREGDNAARGIAASRTSVVTAGSESVGRRWPFATLAAAESPRQRWSAWAFLVIAAAHVAAAIAALLYRRVTIDLWFVEITINDVTQMLLRAAVFTGVALLVSSTRRRHAHAMCRTHGFFLGALVAALWLSLGPVPQALGRPLELAAPYGVLFDHVPGFDMLSSPARIAAIASLMLAVLGGFGAAVLLRQRPGRPLLAVLVIVFLAESIVVPFPMNQQSEVAGFAPLEPRIYRPGREPGIYQAVARQQPEAILAELPLGRPEHDRRAMFYAAAHHRRIVNGYGTFLPPHYAQLTVATSDVVRFPLAALDALRAVGATLVLVHEGHYLGEAGAQTTAAFLSRGAAEIARQGRDVLLVLP